MRSTERLTSQRPTGGSRSFTCSAAGGLDRWVVASRTGAVADDGDDAADDSEHENQRNTVHDVTSFMRQTRAAANLSAMRAAGE